MDARLAFLLDAQGIIRDWLVYAPGTIPESKDILLLVKTI